MSFAPEALSRDRFLDGRLALLQPRQGYRAAIDPVLLAAFVPAGAGERVLDLGCGAGTAALCLAVRVPGLDLHGLELQANYAGLARQNAGRNGIALHVHRGDLRAPPPALLERPFAQVLANPPFHPAAAPRAGDAGRDEAHREGAAPLALWIDAGLKRLAPGGWFTLIHLAARLGEVLTAFKGRAGGAEVLPVAARAGQPAGRVLVRARKGGRGPLKLLPPLELHHGGAAQAGDDGYTDRARGVLRGAAGLP